MKQLKTYLRCLFKGHDYYMYYKSKWGGEELWYCKRCRKEKMIF